MLKPLRYAPFSARELRPEGWLRQQLQIQADGLSGHLDKIWPDIRDSRWIGGDREGWERVPYWLDGFIPLAWLLDDGDLKARAARYIDAILAGQQEDGWICPCAPEERPRYDVWAVFLIGKVLVEYHACTGDPRVQPAVSRMLRQLLSHIQAHTLFNWGSSRWFECLIPIFWLYERQPEDWLLELASKLEVEGIDYQKLFRRWYDQTPRREWGFLTHVVNLAMALKAGGLMSRLDGRDPDGDAREMLRLLEGRHGNIAGYFSGDECLSGSSPIQGTELCGVVEAMYSYEQLLQISGSPEWADRLELLAFNLLPATMSPDMWSHQYVQMTNQAECTPLPEDAVVFRTNGKDSHTFGLEPNFGCCTANFNQGWPKLALSSFLRCGEGIVSAVLVPSNVSAQVQGVPVTVELQTLYPFRDRLTYTVTAERPVEISLFLRIPQGVSYALVDDAPARPGAFYECRRVWSGRTTVTVELRQEAALLPRPNGLFGVRRGALLYSVAIEEKWERVEYERDGVVRKYPYCDYRITPQSPWNYAYVSDCFAVREHDDFDRPFSTVHPPISLIARAVEIDWGFANGVCFEQPRSRTPLGPPQDIRLIPYGCTNLRMTELPYLPSEPSADREAAPPLSPEPQN